MPSIRKTAVAILLASVSLSLVLPLVGSAQTRLLRFPDIHGDRVVFTYAGDLWSVADTGGTAVRLTAHPGLELFARFSPSGDRIAFTGQYDGDEQVYVIPSRGGEPRQITFYPASGPLPSRWGYDHQVYGWSPDGESILFRGLRDGWSLSDTDLFTVSAEGGLPERLPMPRAGAGDFSPDGDRLAYSPLFRDFRAWKRYAGGWAEDLWTFDLETNEARQITDHPRTERDPMWIGSRIYFDSDRTGKLNLYSVSTDGSDLRQHTSHETWDVRWPAADADGRIVYELGGQLRVFDTRTGEDRGLEIHVPDDGLHARPGQETVAGQIEDFALAPGGARALFVARGDLFTVPSHRGPTRNLTQTSTAHDREARWSPDGRKIAFISDLTGEEELYLVDQAGTGEPERLTNDGEMRRMNVVWSPDSERLAFADKLGRLWVVEVESRDLRLMARDPSGNMFDHAWSPDGRWLAYSTSDADGYRSIWIRALNEDEPRRVTGSMTNDFQPTFSADGRYLFFLSDRAYAPLVSSHEWDFATDRETKILALALAADTPPPFPPRSDEVEIGDTGGEDGATGGQDGTPDMDDGETASSDEQEGDGSDALPEVRVDLEGLPDRIAPVPVEADNYQGLVALEGGLLYLRVGGFYYGRSPARETELVHFDLEEREETTLAEDVQEFAVAPDGSHVLVGTEGQHRMHSLPPGGGDEAPTISTSGLEARIVPREEWAQIFDEVWRRFRDYFYVENMNGYDWEELGDRYRPLLEHVRHRSDLNYVLGEMMAELGQSHTYIEGGDLELPDRPDVALPGIRLRLDEDSGRYRIADILEGDNAEEKYRSPLTEVGVDAGVGDYVLAVDGQDLLPPTNPYELLRNKADRPVTLALAPTPDTATARRVQYQPRTAETDLVYFEWVEANRARVDSLSEGRVGYLHLPDMGADGIAEFVKWFYPQVRKEGLVIDVRGNGGGNVSSMVLERLSRTLLAAGYSRNDEYASTYPRGPVFHGHMVTVLNETSASDGDIFPAMFREAGLGPLIGKRSWGGVTGITNRGTLIDGGTVYVPEFGFISAEGEWIIEGRGVEPDIVVENDPELVLQGRDPQLERAVEEVLQEIEEDPRRLPDRPAPPDRTEDR